MTTEERPTPISDFVPFENGPYDWKPIAEAIHQHFLPTLKMPTDAFLALSLAGEAGEVANEVKKAHRGNLRIIDLNALADEIGDVMALLWLLAEYWEMDLDACAYFKLKRKAAEWGVTIPETVSPSAPEAGQLAQLRELARACEAALFDYPVALHKGYVTEAQNLLKAARSDGLLEEAS